MSKLRLAIVVSARRELRLTAGEVGRDQLDKPEFEHMEEEIRVLEGPTYMRVGLANLGSVHLVGPEVVNPVWPQDSLSLAWYLPDEEPPEAARPVPLSKVGLIPEAFHRPAPEAGHVWRFRVEGWGPMEQTIVYQSGFQPPFKPSDLTLNLTPLAAFGYDSLILSRLLYGHRAPTYIEGDLGLAKLIAEGVLED